MKKVIVQRGMSLLQLMICVTVMAILATHGTASFVSLLKDFYLKGAVQSIYFSFQKARSHAVVREQDIIVDIQSGEQWCLGLTDLDDCDCNQANSCTLWGLDTVISFAEFKYTNMVESTFHDDNQTRFSTPRGMTGGQAGSVTLDSNAQQFRVIVSNTGRVRVCTLTPPAHPYKAC